MQGIFVKNILFKMWERVEIGQFDSRSFVGDTALDLRDIMYENNESQFWEEYDIWKEKQKLSIYVHALIEEIEKNK